jgi:hypothetical protein
VTDDDDVVGSCALVTLRFCYDIAACAELVNKQGVMLEAARGPVPNLAAGGSRAGSWWDHSRGREIFAVTRSVRDAPDVLYKLTRLGMSLGAAFCGVWVWAAENLKQVERARDKFDKKGAADRTDAMDNRKSRES